jgi:rhodanese-related sulfurtransferase
MFNLFKNSNPSSPSVAEMIEKGAFLVDVRTAAEFASGSVKGAVNIPLDQVQSKIDAFRNKKGVVVFCRSGARSGQAKSILDKAGIPDVVNGGGWESVARLKK